MIELENVCTVSTAGELELIVVVTTGPGEVREEGRGKWGGWSGVSGWGAVRR